MNKGEIKEGETIMLDELVRRMRAAGDQPSTKKSNRLLLLNAAAALVALGQELEKAQAKLREMGDKEQTGKRIITPGGLHRVN